MPQADQSPQISQESLRSVLRSWNHRKVEDYLAIAKHAEEHGTINHESWLKFSSANKKKEKLPLPHFEQLGLLVLTDHKNYQLTTKGTMLLKYLTDL